MSRVVWAEESKTGFSFEFGPPQQKYQRNPILQLLSNPALLFWVSRVLLSSKCRCFKNKAILDDRLFLSLRGEGISSMRH